MNDLLKTSLGKLILKNPVMVASGTFGYGEEFQDGVYDISKLGAVVTKGISLKPRKGNPTPRIVETASGMLNAIGLENVGVDKFIKEKLKVLVKARATVVANIFGSNEDEYAEVAARLECADGVSAVEVNISCPNIKCGGIQFGSDPKMAAKVMGVVRKNFSRTVIVKLSPQVADIGLIAKAVEDAGADAVSLINTIPAMAVDVQTRSAVLANVTGGLSGPAIKPVALKLVHDVYRTVKIPVIGLGGIMTTNDALEFFVAGASAIQIGTANFVKPMTAVEIIDGLEKYIKKENVSLTNLVGSIKNC